MGGSTPDFELEQPTKKQIAKLKEAFALYEEDRGSELWGTMHRFDQFTRLSQDDVGGYLKDIVNELGEDRWSFEEFLPCMLKTMQDAFTYIQGIPKKYYIADLAKIHRTPMADQLNDEQIAEFEETFSRFDEDREGMIITQKLYQAMYSLGIYQGRYDSASRVQEELEDIAGGIEEWAPGHMKWQPEGQPQWNFEEFVTLMIRKMKDTAKQDEEDAEEKKKKKDHKESKLGRWEEEQKLKWDRNLAKGLDPATGRAKGIDPSTGRKAEYGSAGGACGE